MKKLLHMCEVGVDTVPCVFFLSAAFIGAIMVLSKTEKCLAAAPPIVLPVAPVSVPLRVTLVPPLTVPFAGEIDVRDGTAALAGMAVRSVIPISSEITAAIFFT